MSATLVQGFDWTTPFIADACALLQLPIRLGPPHIRPIRPAMKVIGRARPAKHAGSTDVFLEAIAAAAPGDVLVIDNVGRLDEGCIGDLVAGEAHVAGLAGIVVWGAHRDTAAIEAIGHAGVVARNVPGRPSGASHAKRPRARCRFAWRTRHRHARRLHLRGRRWRGRRRWREAGTGGWCRARDIAAREQAQAALLMKGDAAQGSTSARRLRAQTTVGTHLHVPRSSAVAGRSHRDLGRLRREAGCAGRPAHCFTA